MANMKKNYITPAMEAVNIEMEQAILTGSDYGQNEDLGEEKEEIGWSNERRGTWGNLWAE